MNLLVRYIIIFLLFLNLNSCGVASFPNASEKFNGLLSYFLGVENNLNNASILLTGTLTDTSDNPLVNYSLTTKFNYFRQATDKTGSTSETGFFSLNLSPGVFTINIYNSFGEVFGSFDVQLIDSETDPIILSAIGNFRISGLTAQPYLGECASLCGDIMGIYSGVNDENLLVISHQDNNPILYVSFNEGKSFSKYPISIPNCTSTFSSTEIIGCRLFYAGYDGLNYLVVAGKTVCTYTSPGSPCNNSSILLYMGVSQDLSNLNLFQPAFSANLQNYYFYSFPEGSFYYRNGLLFLSYSYNNNILVINTSGNLVSTLQDSCNTIFYNDSSNQVFCDMKHYFDFNSLTWMDTGFTSTNLYRTSYLDGIFKTVEMVYSQTGEFYYEFASFDSSFNRKLLSSLQLNQTGGYQPSGIKKAGFNYKSLYSQNIADPNDPYSFSSKLYQLSSIDGINYTNTYIKYPVNSGDVTATTGFTTHRNKFYIAGILGVDPSKQKSYLLVANPSTSESKWRAIPIK